MAYRDTNVFAQILRGNAPAFKVYENDSALAFMDIMPQMDGHTLVIPKSAAENLHDVEPEILGETIKVVQLVSGAVQRAFEAPGSMIAQLNGAAAGQTVFHLHFHIMPRFEGLDFKLHAREVEDGEKLAEFAQRIRTQLL